MYVKRLLKDGISVIDGKIVMNTDRDTESDILNIVEPCIYESDFMSNVYYFGYTFKDSAGRKDRTAIIKWLKNLDGAGIDDKSLQRFIEKPLFYLNKSENLFDFSLILYPRSNRSNLTKAIIKELNRLTSHELEKNSFEDVMLIKSESTEHSESLIKSIQDGKILIVDDINTSGATLTEILRIVKSINKDCEIFIFTLLGK